MEKCEDVPRDDGSNLYFIDVLGGSLEHTDYVQLKFDVQVTFKISATLERIALIKIQSIKIATTQHSQQPLTQKIRSPAKGIFTRWTTITFSRQVNAWDIYPDGKVDYCFARLCLDFRTKSCSIITEEAEKVLTEKFRYFEKARGSILKGAPPNEPLPIISGYIQMGVNVFRECWNQ